jgi:hypothetical protein
MTARREKSTPRRTTKDAPPGLRTYADVFVALVPADVLAAAVAMQSAFTETTRTSETAATVTVTNHGDLKLAFFVLVALGPFLYFLGHTKGGRDFSLWSKADVLRMLIPAGAFVGWAMVQRPALFFDAAISISDGKKVIFTVAGAVVLGAFANGLAVKADRQEQKGA